MKKRLPIGVSNFSKMIEESLYFVDKSLIIKELLEDGSEIVLLTRPRRFGKTLNMSMIRNFFEKTNEDKSYLFKDLKIWQYKSSLGIIIEFKKAIERKKETLKIACEKALKQIEEKRYDVEMEDRGVKDIIKLGIAFKGKEVLVLEGQDKLVRD